MSGGCCSPLGPGTGPVAAFYQTIIDSDGGDAIQEPALQFGPGFSVIDEPGFATRVNLSRAPLPSVGAPDIGEQLQVASDGAGGALWTTAANGFLQVATVAGLATYPGLRTPGMLAYVPVTQCLYMLAQDGTTWNFFAPSPALALQAAWFVDAGVAGNDNNSGLVGSPLKTSTELSRRLSPNGAVYAPQQVTTLNFAAGAYTNFYLNLTNSTTTTVTLLGTTTTSAPITLAAGTTTPVPATNTRGKLVTAAGVFAVGNRVRVTSGTANGAVTYVTELSGDPQHAFVKECYRFSDGSAAFPVAGDTVVVETIATTFSRIGFDSNVLANNAASGLFNIQDVGGISSVRAHSAGVGLQLVQCELANNSQVIADGAAIGYFSCRNLGTVTINNGTHTFTGHCASGLISCLSSAQVRFSQACCSVAATIGLSAGGTSQRQAVQAVFKNNYEMVSGAGLIGFTLGAGCTAIFEALVWGASTA